MELSNTEIEIVVKNMAREMVKRVTAKNADKSDYQKFRDMFFQKHGIKSEADAQKYAGTKEGAKLDKEYKEEYQRYMAAKNAALREVAVTYSDGTTITTSMAAHLSDADIKNYFRIGQEFNIGSGAKDKMVKVKSVKILNATAKNAEGDDIKKMRVRNLLIRRGGNPSDVDKMLLKSYAWAASRYDSVQDIAEAVRTMAGR